MTTIKNMSTDFSHDRIDRISKIMPEFCNVAHIGDEVMLGLQGDPSFPFEMNARPTAKVAQVQTTESGPQVTLQLSDGREKTVNKYTIAPGDVFEYTDASFTNVLARVRAKQTSIASPKETPMYRGVDLADLREEITQLRSELHTERELTRSFHQIYLAGLKELTNDVCELDPSGNNCKFCRTYALEYDKMQSRAEEGLYRGTNNRDETEADHLEANDDHESNNEDDEVNSLSSEDELDVAESDFF